MLADVAKHNGNVVGFGDALDYGPLAYIGLMSAHPSQQRQGIVKKTGLWNLHSCRRRATNVGACSWAEGPWP